MKSFKYKYSEYIEIENKEAAFIVGKLEDLSNNLLEDFHYIFKDTNKYLPENSVNINKTLLVYKNNKKFAEVNFYIKNYQLYINFNLQPEIMHSYELLNFKLSFLKNKTKKFNLLNGILKKNKKEKAQIIFTYKELIHNLQIKYEVLYANIYKLITNLIKIISDMNIHVRENISLKLNFNTKDMYKNLHLSDFNNIFNKKELNNNDVFFKNFSKKSKREKLFLNNLLNTIDNKDYNIIYDYLNCEDLNNVKFLNNIIIKKRQETLSYNLFVTFFNKEFTDKYNLSKFEKEKSYFNKSTEYMGKEKIEKESESDLFLLESILSMIEETKEPIKKIKYYYSLFQNKELFYEYNPVVLRILDMAIRKEVHPHGNLYFKSKDEIAYEFVNKYGNIMDLIVINLQHETISFTDDYYSLNKNEMLEISFYEFDKINIIFSKIQGLFNNLIVVNNHENRSHKLSYNGFVIILNEKDENRINLN